MLDFRHLRLLLPLAVLGASVACGDSGDGPAGPGPDGDDNLEPVASFQIEASGSAAPVGIAVDGSASSDGDGDVVSWSWSFGDGASAQGPLASHVYAAAGSYEVTLTVEDDRGARSSTSRTVSVTAGAPGRIVGVVWHDRDNDGVRDAGDDGVPGQRVFVDDNRNGALDAGEPTVLTGPAGVYAFSGLPPGEHAVTQALGIGWTNTAPGPAGAPEAGPPPGGPARILSGEVATDPFPFMVSMQLASQSDPQQAHICGGSLVAPRWVLTASHCLSDAAGQPFPDGFLEVLVGTKRLDGSGARIPIERIVLNPGYSPSGGFYKRDVSLVELAAPVTDLPRVFLMDSTLLAAHVRPGDLGTIPGWGRLGDAAGIPVDLQVADIPLRPEQDCRNSWNDGEVERFDATMLCVGHRAGTPDTCSGDSGGPWMFSIGGRLHQAGAVSWGPIPCGRPTIPSAFASIPAMYAFLDAHIPREPSGTVVVALGDAGATVDFGNFH